MSDTTFHPANNLPACMMPDGGECCAGYVALVDDWRKQRARIAALEAALRKATEPCGECHLQPGEVCDICGRRAALAPEQDK